MCVALCRAWARSKNNMCLDILQPGLCRVLALWWGSVPGGVGGNVPCTPAWLVAYTGRDIGKLFQNQPALLIIICVVWPSFLTRWSLYSSSLKWQPQLKPCDWGQTTHMLGWTLCELGCSHHLSESEVVNVRPRVRWLWIWQHPPFPKEHLRKNSIEVNIKMCQDVNEIYKCLCVIVNVLF